MFNAEGSFARKHLEKLGWADGRGLGAGQQGISQAIRVKIKHDTTGVGHDHAKEFSDHWWDHVFHKAAASLVVKNGKDGAVVKKKIITQKQRTETAKKALYGNFIKGHLLTDGTETQVEKEGEDTESSDDETKARVHTLLLPDDELFEKCGGRTAHKGARHGLKLNGKLARIQEQERHLAAKNHNSSSATSSPQPQPEEAAQQKKKKKSKKRKREEKDSENEVECTNSSENVNSSVHLVAGGQSFVEQTEDGYGDSKKKKKKRRKERVEERESYEEKERRKEGASDKESENQNATQEEQSVTENGEAERKKEKKKRKKERKEREREEKRRAELEEGEEVDESNVTLEASFPNMDTSTTIENEEMKTTKEKKKEKKKRKKDRA